MALTEDDVVTAGLAMLEQHRNPQDVTEMFALFEGKIDGRRTPYDATWWKRMTAPPSAPIPLRTRRRSSTHKRT